MFDEVGRCAEKCLEAAAKYGEVCWNELLFIASMGLLEIAEWNCRRMVLFPWCCRVFQFACLEVIWRLQIFEFLACHARLYHIRDCLYRTPSRYPTCEWRYIFVPINFPFPLKFVFDKSTSRRNFLDPGSIRLNWVSLPVWTRAPSVGTHRCESYRTISPRVHWTQVIIITNSDDGWVKFSAERFVPNLLPVIERYRIVSARTRYERFYPNSPLCWKAAAFAHEANEIYENDMNASIESMEGSDVSSDCSLASTVDSRKREIISFGDSMEERTAVRIVSGQLSAVPKSVMFISSPSPLQLIGQLNMVTSHMKFVCEHESSLDLEISPHQAQRCAEKYMGKISLGVPVPMGGVVGWRARRYVNCLEIGSVGSFL